jgi:hypothetical protein
MMNPEKQLCLITDVDGEEMTVSYFLAGCRIYVIDLLQFFNRFEWIASRTQ